MMITVIMMTMLMMYAPVADGNGVVYNQMCALAYCYAGLMGQIMCIIMSIIRRTNGRIATMNGIMQYRYNADNDAIMLQLTHTCDTNCRRIHGT